MRAWRRAYVQAFLRLIAPLLAFVLAFAALLLGQMSEDYGLLGYLVSYDVDEARNLSGHLLTMLGAVACVAAVYFLGYFVGRGDDR
jgi:hypothetical protein